MSQASITKKVITFPQPVEYQLLILKVLVKHWTSANCLHGREWGKSHEFNLTTHHTYIFRYLGLGEWESRSLKKFSGCSTWLRSCEQKYVLGTTNSTWQKHYTSAPFPQNNIFMDISSYETSFPHFLGYLSGSLPMVKRIFWQGVLEKAQNFRNGGENGGKRKGYDITSPSSISSEETKHGVSHTVRYHNDSTLSQEQEWENPSIYATSTLKWEKFKT